MRSPGADPVRTFPCRGFAATHISARAAAPSRKRRPGLDELDRAAQRATRPAALIGIPTKSGDLVSDPSVAETAKMLSEPWPVWQ